MNIGYMYKLKEHNMFQTSINFWYDCKYMTENCII